MSGEPLLVGVTGEIGGGAEVVRLTGGDAARAASIRPISLACKSGDSAEMRAASDGLDPKW